MHRHVVAVEQIVGHHFSQQDLIVAALTHPSAVEGRSSSDSYERLEFLGDSILGALVALALFERFPAMDEGALTRLKISLVSGKTLAEVAGSLGIGEHIAFGESERGTGARGLHSALENVYEAIVGALYLDGGFDAARSFVMDTLGNRMTPEFAGRPDNPKSRLQEVVQGMHRLAPEYRLEGERGPAHRPTFTSVVLVSGRRMGRGSGPTKKESEAAAAADALVRLAAGKVEADVELGHGAAPGARMGGERPCT